MRKPALAVFLSLVSLGASHPMDSGTANAITETRNVPTFSSITLNGISTVRIHKGPQAVRVTIDGNLIDRYETKVKDGTLLAGFKCSLNIAVMRAINNLKHCEVDITIPELDGIVLNGLGTIIVDAFPFKDLKLTVTGAGSVELQGSASKLQVKSTGSAKIYARDLVAEVARATVTGAGIVELMVEEELDASVSGAGKILYWGNPRVTQRITGAGSVVRAGSQGETKTYGR